MRTFLKTHAMTFSILLTLGVSLGIQAQAFQADSKKPEAEAIDVVGEKPLSFYRKSLHKAEDSFFGLMNSMVEDEDFKVSCETKLVQAFSRLKERVCEANFVSRIMAGETREQAETTRSNLPSSTKLRKELEKAQREYVEIMVEKINSSPELLQAYQQMELAKQQYQRAKDI